MALCPTCHSDIGIGDLDLDNRVKGAQGLDAAGNPVPFWSDDPILTRLGFNGSEFKGSVRVKKKHIQEIQELRNEEELATGLTETDFSDVDVDNRISRRHIVELRESIERILSANQVSLEEYFKTDIAGDEQPQNPKLTPVGAASLKEPQVEWIDVKRGFPYITKDGNTRTTFEISTGVTEDSPTLPEKIRIRAVHIEDLRHHIVKGIPALLVGGSVFSGLFTGRKDQIRRTDPVKGATFRNVKPCQEDI